MKIVISGTVGVGKSTVSKMLYEKLINKNLNVKLYKELKGQNPYLSFYYENKPEWSFLIQIDFLLYRHKLLVKETVLKNQNKILIFDRHFLDDYVFANLKSIKENMGYINFNIYKSINKTLAEKIKNQQPDLFILLKTDLQNIIKRINQRGRTEEKKVDISYWKDLYYQYYNNPYIENYLNENTKKLIILDASLSATQIVEEITKYLVIPKKNKKIEQN